jgi:hypothetical protein
MRRRETHLGAVPYANFVQLIVRWIYTFLGSNAFSRSCLIDTETKLNTYIRKTVYVLLI